MEIDVSNVNFIPSDQEVEKKKKKSKNSSTTKNQESSEDLQKELKKIKKNSTKLTNDVKSLYENYPDKKLNDVMAYLESVQNLINNLN